MTEIQAARIPDVLPVIKELFLEYADSLGFELDFQDFNEELDTVPGKCVPPFGSILVSKETGETVGCVAVRLLGDGVCEIKRLYVKPAHRGKNLGRDLALTIIEEANRLGNKVMRLDTVVEMKEASALYQTGMPEVGLHVSPIIGNELDGLLSEAYMLNR